MPDFETHHLGTAKELRLSRKFVTIIDNEFKQGQIQLSPEAHETMVELLKHYQWQIENESH